MPELGERSVDEHVDLLALHHVGAHADRLGSPRAGLGCDGARAVLVEVTDDHVRAFGRRREHAPAADALRAADDDDGLVVEPSHQWLKPAPGDPGSGVVRVSPTAR